MSFEHKRPHVDIDDVSNQGKRLRSVDEGQTSGLASLNNNQAKLPIEAKGIQGQYKEEETTCADCGYPGIMKFQSTEILFFRVVTVMSFACENCRFENTEIQPESAQDRGTQCTFRVETIEDLERQVFKSESCVCLFQELELEIPAKRSQVTTIASILRQIIYDLSADQPSRLHFDVETYLKIKTFLDKLGKIIFGDEDCFPLSFIIDDPTGNSFIEYNPNDAINKWTRSDYTRES